jgi:diguanylate cyclase (GGDEF)-like protein
MSEGNGNSPISKPPTKRTGSEPLTVNRWARLHQLEEEVKGLGPDQVARRLFARERLLDRERNLRAVDSLTGLYAARTFDRTLDREIDTLERDPLRIGLGLVLLDLDNFGPFNKLQGKLAGDSVLSNVGKTIKKTIRKTDIPVREGGEELAVIAPHVTNEQLSLNAKPGTHHAERLRKAIQASSTPEGYKVTASVGTTEYIRGESRRDFYTRADRARRMAKARGKNRTVQARVVDGQLIADDLTSKSSYIVDISINEENAEVFHFTPFSQSV